MEHMAEAYDLLVSNLKTKIEQLEDMHQKHVEERITAISMLLDFIVENSGKETAMELTREIDKRNNKEKPDLETVVDFGYPDEE